MVIKSSSRAEDDYCFLRTSVSKEMPGWTVDKILSTSEVISERFFSEAFFSTKTLILKVIKIRDLISPRDAFYFLLSDFVSIHVLSDVSAETSPPFGIR